MNSLVAIACRNNFAKYYPVFMPGLKTIISTIQNDTPQKDMIRAKTVETMGHLLSSVKDHETLFKPDCEMIMQSLINLESQLADDDTLHRAMFTVYENVVECLRSGFEVYSDFVMKKVLEAVNRKVDFKVIDETDSQQPKKNPNMNKLVKMKLDFKIDGVKSLVLNTDHLEQKI